MLWSRLEKDSATASSVEVAGTWSKTSGMTAAVVLATLIPMLNVGPCYDYDDSEELFGLEMAVEGPLGGRMRHDMEAFGFGFQLGLHINTCRIISHVKY